MGKRKWTDDHFSNRLKTEREQRGWSQAEMAKMLRDNGIEPMHWTTVAKIEKGTRSVRIDEAAGIADLFGTSVDVMLGRGAKQRVDLIHTLSAVVDTAYRSATQVHRIRTALGDRVTDLSALDDLPARDALVAGCERARALLMSADDEFTALGAAGRKIVNKELKAR